MTPAYARLGSSIRDALSYAIRKATDEKRRDVALASAAKLDSVEKGNVASLDAGAPAGGNYTTSGLVALRRSSRVWSSAASHFKNAQGFWVQFAK